jgi:nicotinamidase-related amidase
VNQVVDLRAFTRAARLPTLVLVDLQQDYLAPSRVLDISDAPGALANCRLALAHARSMNMPVAYTRWAGARSFGGRRGNAGPIEGFEPHGPDSIFERKQPSCYASPHFAEVIANNGGNFIMAGFAGEAACLATAIEAFHRGHRVTYLSDASASCGFDDMPSGAVHDVVRRLIGRWGAVMKTESWIRATSRTAERKTRQLFGGRT